MDRNERREREHDGANWTSRIELLSRDFKYALRGLLKTPTFTIVVVLTLALVIGANAAVFGLLNALMFRKLPVQAPDSLVELSVATRVSPEGPVSYPMIRAFEQDRSTWADVFGWSAPRLSNVEAPRGTFRHAVAVAATGNYHAALGLTPRLGRLLEPADAVPNGPAVAVLGYELWQQAFGGDPSVIGQLIAIEGVPFTIVGVTPEAFNGLTVTVSADVTVPFSTWPRITNQPPDSYMGDAMWLNATGRLKDGVSPTQARARLSALWSSIKQQLVPPAVVGTQRDEFLAMRLVVKSAAAGVDPFYGTFRNRYVTALHVVLGVALLMLFIGLLNIASLEVSRSWARRQEFSVKSALGASRPRLVQQVLVEGILLTLTGVTVGVLASLAVSTWIAKTILADYPVPFNFDPTPDRLVLAFVGVLALIVVVVLGISPIWTNRYVIAGRDDSQSRTVTRSGRTGRRLVTAQVALSILLTVPAGLLIRSLQQLRAVETGVTTRDAMVAVFMAKPRAYLGINNDVYYPALVERLQGLPGVTRVAVSQFKPFMGGLTLPISQVGAPDRVPAFYDSISPGLFDALGVKVLAGRDFRWADSSTSPQVAIVSQSLARRLFGGSEAVGRRIQVDPRHTDVQVVGVVGDGRVVDMRAANASAVYLPSLQVGPAGNNKFVIIRGRTTSGDVASAVDSLGRERLLTAQTLPDLVDRVLVQDRIVAILAAFFGGLTLLLSFVGVYGIMSFTVVQRTQEIGLRLALGSSVRDLIRWVVWDGATIAIRGILVGLVAAWATAGVIQSLLFAMQPHDLRTFVVAPLLLLVMALVGSFIPARSAARVDPVLALRAE
ncbi:MAG TPA: ADOP family duplicated permease [Vicinamibacterales bacterium]|nr:ADOP family duplicated permease [Vicinamibacterales bacterium]